VSAPLEAPNLFVGVRLILPTSTGREMVVETEEIPGLEVALNFLLLLLLLLFWRSLAVLAVLLAAVSREWRDD